MSIKLFCAQFQFEDPKTRQAVYVNFVEKDGKAVVSVLVDGQETVLPNPKGYGGAKYKPCVTHAMLAIAKARRPVAKPATRAERIRRNARPSLKVVRND